MRCGVSFYRVQGPAFYKVKGPVPGSEQRNGFLGKWACAYVFESKGDSVGSFS